MTVPAVTAQERLAEIRTPEQMEWIRVRFKPDGLVRLARSTQDYYDHKGYYLPDVAALAYANGLERDALLAVVSQMQASLTRIADYGCGCAGCRIARAALAGGSPGSDPAVSVPAPAPSKGAE